MNKARSYGIYADVGSLQKAVKDLVVRSTDGRAFDVNGPQQPLASGFDAAMRLHQTGHSCVARHFR